jgi:integrase
MVRNDGAISDGLGLAPGTVRTTKNVLKNAFNFAVDNGFIAENPVVKTKIPVSDKTSASSLTIEEANAFVSVEGQFWYDLAFVFQLHTGLRPQELMALVWDDVDFKNGTVRIERACKWVKGICVGIGRTKTKRGNRVLELEAEQLALLQLQLEKQQKAIERCNRLNIRYGDDEIKKWISKERPRHAHLYTKTNLIFPKRDGGVPSYNVPYHRFKKMLRRAGITGEERDFRWYDLRHSHASILLAAGIPIPEIAERMGHSINTFLTTYAHALRNRRRDASRVFADLVPILAAHS